MTAIGKLQRIMACLRHPEYGCPWDLEQNLESLTRYTLEEVYEVVDAVENGTPDKLKDELGDLLFQIVFYCRIAEEAGQFDLSGIAEAISAKLLRRHPHVFPDGSLDSFGQPQTIDASRVVSNWEAIKQQEREQKGSDGKSLSILADIPTAFPALKRATKLQSRAASVGFDWKTAEEVLAKVREELHELEEEIGGKSRSAAEDELGDVLFAIVNLARHLGIEPETALRASNRKFVRRFEHIESALKQSGVPVAEAGQERLESLWNDAKQNGL